MFKLGQKGNLVFEQSPAVLGKGLIGSTFHRREPAGDEYDTVKIVGVTPVLDGHEIVYQPLAFGESLQAAPESFAAIYSKDDETTLAMRDIERRMQELTA